MINEIRNTVLAILNKENYGYITPETFNLYSKMAQLEIFEEHFFKFARAKQQRVIRQIGEDYSDDVKKHQEAIEYFSINIQMLNPEGDFLIPTDVRHINVITYGYNINNEIQVEIEKVTRREIVNLNTSLLTKPSLTYPVYTQGQNYITVYPSDIDDDVFIDYIRYPLDPKWTYISLTGGEPVFNAGANDYQDFEVPLSDYAELTVKILQHCGVTIRENVVAQVAAAEEQILKSV